MGGSSIKTNWPAEDAVNHTSALFIFLQGYIPLSHWP